VQLVQRVGSQQPENLVFDKPAMGGSSFQGSCLMHDARSAMCAVRNSLDVPFRDVFIGHTRPYCTLGRTSGWFKLMTLRAALCRLSALVVRSIRSFLVLIRAVLEVGVGGVWWMFRRCTVSRFFGG